MAAALVFDVASSKRWAAVSSRPFARIAAIMSLFSTQPVKLTEWYRANVFSWDTDNLAKVIPTGSGSGGFSGLSEALSSNLCLLRGDSAAAASLSIADDWLSGHPLFPSSATAPWDAAAAAAATASEAAAAAASTLARRCQRDRLVPSGAWLAEAEAAAATATPGPCVICCCASDPVEGGAATAGVGIASSGAGAEPAAVPALDAAAAAAASGFSSFPGAASEAAPAAVVATELCFLASATRSSAVFRCSGT
mmetsp:Transcript_77181/g.160651  ORF Transcript_77181/g.160651 Transcript_77181/m.160651 type:complete len:252 (-) Transcript_77181:329-1084(-)